MCGDNNGRYSYRSTQTELGFVLSLKPDMFTRCAEKIVPIAELLIRIRSGDDAARE